MKNKYLKGFLMILLAVIFIAFFFVMSIMDLTNKDDVHETKIDAAGQLLVVENSINGIIPTGKDYYYIGMNEDSGEIYTIHAGKNWLKKNFDSDGMAKGNGVKIKGLSKSAGDYEVKDEIASRVNQIKAELGGTFVLESGNVLELNYVQDSIVRLIAGTLLIALIILGFAATRRKEAFPAWFGKAVAVVTVLAMVFVIVVIF